MKGKDRPSYREARTHQKSWKTDMESGCWAGAIFKKGRDKCFTRLDIRQGTGIHDISVFHGREEGWKRRTTDKSDSHAFCNILITGK